MAFAEYCIVSQMLESNQTLLPMLPVSHSRYELCLGVYKVYFSTVCINALLRSFASSNTP